MCKIQPHTVAAFVLAWATLAAAQQAPKLSTPLLEALPLRSIGPAVTPGRVSDIAVDPKNDSTWYITMASGGVWKTTNRGLAWRPIFDDYGSFSIGCITLDPKDSNILYLGTGENQAQRSVGFGDGIYKSSDSGKTWKNIGLGKSEHLGKILVDPRNSNTLYVAAQGPLWAPGGDRGVYKTTDGGATWKAVLQISENTGVADIAQDPNHPDILYAAAYQRRRNVGVLVGGGPEGALYKSTDAGEHWTKQTKGLPTADVGRIGLAISPQKPEVVYAYITAAQNQQGFYRSEDQGENWVRQSNLNSVDPQYYGEVYTDPHQFDHLWIMDVNVHETADGGQTFRNAFNGIHVDNHALWLDPKDSRHILEGNDGGLYETFDGTQSWRHFTNLPTIQFYHVGVDNALPFYNIAGGAQDNGSTAGPSGTVNRVGIRPGDWITIGGADGMQPRMDPEDSAIVYSMSQNGAISRLDKRTSLSKSIGVPNPGGRGGRGGAAGGAGATGTAAEALRWNWDAPFVVSGFAHEQLYLAADRLFRSNDRGDSWTAISGDLTRHLNRDSIEIMGRLWDNNAISRNLWTTDLSVCTTMAESPKNENTLVVGTDDGLVQITEDGGKNWRKVETFPGVPEMALVSCVAASTHDGQTLFATFNNYQRGDFKPYVLKSTDLGKTWVSIAGDLPARHPVWSILEDPVNKDLLFAGTEFGLFVTVDGGKQWVQMKGNVPTIAFRDLQLQKRESDLVGATFGRGVFVLDDITPLRGLADALGKDFALFPMRRAQQFAELTFVRGGAEEFVGPNAPHGAIITYYVGQNQPDLTLAIADAAGTSLRQIVAPGTAGLHRVAWDLRGGTPGAAAAVIQQGEEFNPDEGDDEDADASPEGAMTGPPDATRGGATQPAETEAAAQTEPAGTGVARAGGARGAGGRGGFGGSAGGGRGGGGRGGANLPQVKPGTYTVTLGRSANGAFTPVAPPQSLEVVPLQSGK